MIKEYFDVEKEEIVLNKKDNLLEIHLEIKKENAHKIMEQLSDFNSKIKSLLLNNDLDDYKFDFLNNFYLSYESKLNSFEKMEILYNFLYKNFIKATGGDLLVKKFYFSIEEDNLLIIGATEKIVSLIKENIEKYSNLFKNIGLEFNKISYAINSNRFSAPKIEQDIIEEQIISNSENKQNFIKNDYQDSFKKTRTSTTYNPLTLDNLFEHKEFKNITFRGKIFSIEEKKYSNGKGKLFSISIYNPNFNKSLNSIKFTSNIEEKLEYKIDDYVEVGGNYKKDTYSRDENTYQIIISFIRKAEYVEENSSTMDSSLFKDRIELSLHTSMSTMDGIGDIKRYIEQANKQKVTDFIVTDTNSVQSYPDAYNFSKNNDSINIHYGIELDVIDDINTVIVRNERDQKIVNADIIFFDIESTGLSSLFNEMIEFGAVKIKEGNVEVTDFFVKPTKPIPKHIEALTHISNNDVKNGMNEKDALLRIKEYFGDSIIVAHNADFDIGFINNLLIKNDMQIIKNPVIDTLKLSWLLNPDSSRHTLGTLAKKYDVVYDEYGAHRGDYDADVLSKVFERMLVQMKEQGIVNLLDINKKIETIQNNYFSKRINVIAKNQEGLKQIYKLVSLSHIEYFNQKKSSPSIPLSVLKDFKTKGNLLLGSNTDLGFLWDEINNGLSKEFFLDLFDYYEVNSLSGYIHLIENNYFTEEEIKKAIEYIYELGKKHSKLVTLSGNVYYPEEKDYLARSIYIMNKGIRGKIHRLYPRNHAKLNFPKVHLKNSYELEQEMDFLDSKLLKELLFDNPQKLIKELEKVIPLKDGLFTPKIENSKEEFLDLINKNLTKKYGKKVHPFIQERLDRELNSIIGNGFDIIYYLSSLAVRQSLKDGYLVGSRGSVGSSLVATLSEITEVNPLPAHYYCPKCKTVEFVEGYDCGFDLPAKKCSKCKTDLKGEGNNIPFETFLGFRGEKVPDIDLNFSGEYQLKIHDFIRDFLGKDSVFRAGTISTVAKRTAYGYILNYLEQTNENTFQKADIDFLSRTVEGTKRTTGQHPGGLIIVPNYMDIYDFTPINFPGNDANSDWKTTHFDFHSIHDNLLKLDFLGHIDPTVLKMLYDLTNVDPKSIYLGDKEVLELFDSTKSLKVIDDRFFKEELGILGIPEFGTSFVRDLVTDSKPKSFADLVRISGLSHGTDVWLGNAKDLILNNIAKLEDVICVRDDIMTYLMNQGLSNDDSFKIMEQVRKGKSITKEQEKLMKQFKVPNWYIDSCKKIKYMFPKAHATAYVMMAFRIAWYKINYPMEYYATFFTKRDTEFDWYMLFETENNQIRTKNIDKIHDSFNQLLAKPDKTDKEKVILQTMEIFFEMYARGFKIKPIDLNKSKSSTWTIDKANKALIPPFNIIEGLGDVIAQKIEKQLSIKPFVSINDFMERSGVNKTQFKFFEDNNLLTGIISPDEVEKAEITGLKQKSFF